MKIYFIAGENSGDFIGASIIKALKKSPSLAKSNSNKNIDLFGIGGNKMQAEGLVPLFPIEKINLMGFFEVLPHLLIINDLINLTVNDAISREVDIIITIDSPGFTYRVAERVRRLAPHIKLIHIVAPSVWAYKPGRARKYAKIYDHLLTLLPFEPEYFIKEGLKSTCIGHPVLEQDFHQKSPNLRAEMNLSEDKKIIAVTPGSRKGEIRRHMPIIRAAFDKLSTTHNIEVIFVQPNENNIKKIAQYLEGSHFNYIFSTERLKSFAVCDCALAKSGTNTLEITASGAPQIVGYKLNPITFFALKAMIKVKYASLINIIPNREIIPEYIQNDFNVENIVFALSDLLNDENARISQVKEGTKILERMGLNNINSPSKKAARIILSYI